MSDNDRRQRAKNALDLLQDFGRDAPAPEAADVPESVATHASVSRDLLAGGLVALIAVPMCLSSSALIYSGDLSPLMPVGVAGAMIGACVVAAVVAYGGSIPFSIGTVALEIGIVLAYISSHVAAELKTSPATYPTVFAAVILGTAVTGVCLMLIGRLGIGSWIRFMPYTVIAGFLAGMGWLAFAGAFRVMSGVSLSFDNLPLLFSSEKLWLWGPGAAFAASLILVRSRTNHFLVMPVLVTSWFLLFNATCGVLTLMSIEFPPGFFFKSVSPAGFVQFVQQFDVRAIDFHVIWHQVPLYGAMVLMATSSILLNCSVLEVAWGADCDPDRELRASGVASLLSAVLGGMAGHLSLGMSMLAYEAGGRSRVVGRTMSACVLGVLLVGTPLVAYYPRPVIGGLLLSFGIAMLAEYVVLSYARLPRSEWLLIATITGVIAVVGLMEGILAGMVLACVQFAVTCSREQVIKNEYSGRSHRSRKQRSIPEQFVLQRHGERTVVLELQGFLFFGVATALLDRLKKFGERPLDSGYFVVFDFRLVNGIDSSAVNCFKRMKQIAGKRSIEVILAGMTAQHRRQLEAGGCRSDSNAFRFIEDFDGALESCEDQILESVVLRRARVVPVGMLLGQMQLAGDVSGELVKRLERVLADPGTTIFRPGEPRNTVYFIESGRIYESGEGTDGVTSVRTWGPGSVLCESAPFEDRTHATTAIAEQRCVLFLLTRDTFRRFQQEHPEMSIALLEFFIRLLVTRAEQD